MSAVAALVEEASHSAPGLQGLTAKEYYALCRRGVFGDQRTELLDGVIELVAAERPYHNAIVRLLLRIFDTFENEGVYSYTATVEVDEWNAPDPDVYVNRTAFDAVRPEDEVVHAEEVLLAVEVSFSTLSKDRGRKSRKYAEGGIPEYWIVNAKARQVEVRRNPRNGEYRSIEIVGDNGAIRPLFSPEREIAVAKILPRA